MPQPQRKIGDTLVSAQGYSFHINASSNNTNPPTRLGCMGMSFGYTSFGGYDDTESAKVLTRAADLGITFWDTSDVYGPHTNERLIGKWFKDTGRRKEIFLATKFGNVFEGEKRYVRGDAAYVKEACEASLERLGVDQIDVSRPSSLTSLTATHGTDTADTSLQSYTTNTASTPPHPSKKP